MCFLETDSSSGLIGYSRLNGILALSINSIAMSLSLRRSSSVSNSTWLKTSAKSFRLSGRRSRAPFSLTKGFPFIYLSKSSGFITLT